MKRAQSKTVQNRRVEYGKQKYLSEFNLIADEIETIFMMFRIKLPTFSASDAEKKYLV